MQNGAEGHAGPPDFLSTHSDMGERLATLVTLAAPPLAEVHRLLPGENWEDIRSLCRLQPGSRPELVSLDLL
jgi:hypothetical protein